MYFFKEVIKIDKNIAELSGFVHFLIDFISVYHILIKLGRTAFWELSLKAASTVCEPFPARAPSRAPNMRIKPATEPARKNASCATGFLSLHQMLISFQPV